MSQSETLKSHSLLFKGIFLALIYGMRRILIYLLIAFSITSCGDNDENNTKDTESFENNLFNVSGNGLIEKDLDPTLIGLWTSEPFVVDDITYRIMWEVTQEDTTIALRCQLLNQQPKFVQVVAEYNDDLVRALDNIGMKDLVLPIDFFAEDSKNVFPETSLAVQAYPKPEKDENKPVTTDDQNSFSDFNSMTQNNWIPVQGENSLGSQSNEDFYIEPLCYISVNQVNVSEKGLLASGMEQWSIPENEDHTDGIISLNIEGLEESVQVIKTQNR